jgi:putative oxidoreductase
METMPTKIIRVLAGLLLVVSGMNKFLHFLPMPEHNTAAGAFLGALAGTGYMFPIIGLVETACGAAFVVGRFVALAAVVMAPISVNIVLVHAVLDSAGAGPAFFVGLANAYLLAVNFPKYQDMLMPR